MRKLQEALGQVEQMLAAGCVVNFGDPITEPLEQPSVTLLPTSQPHTYGALVTYRGPQHAYSFTLRVGDHIHPYSWFQQCRITRLTGDATADGSAVAQHCAQLGDHWVHQVRHGFV
jgi:hypothetical protein